MKVIQHPEDIQGYIYCLKMASFLNIGLGKLMVILVVAQFIFTRPKPRSSLFSASEYFADIIF